MTSTETPRRPATDRRSDYLVDSAWLTAHLAEPGVRVYDCRFAGDRESSRQAYRDGHVPGAAYVYWLDDLCAADTRVTTLLPDPDQAAAALGRLGIGPDTLVVGYADQADLYAARLWHVLRWVGHRQVRLLDGGLEGWLAAGGALETGDRQPDPADFPVPAITGVTVAKEELLDRLTDASLQLLDVRSPAEYDGTTARAARGGHLPGAVLLPWTDLVEDGHYRSADGVRARCRQAGIDLTGEVVAYCQGGVRAAHTALALRMAGADRVRVYDGSWAEWGNDPALPVSTGSTP